MLHTINPEILFLKQEDVIKAGLLDMKQILAVTEKTYAMLGQGLIKNPPKTNTSIPDKENWQSFFNAMPCYIGGDINIGGIKWAAESKKNATIPGIPYGIVITNSILRSGGSANAVGFLSDGSALIGDPTVAVTLDYGADTPLVLNYNKAMTVQNGVLLYSQDYDTRTKNTIDGYHVIVRPVGSRAAELRLGQSLTVEVIGMVEDTKSCSIPEDGFLLAIANDTAYKSALAALKGMVMGQQMTIQVTCASGWENVTSACGGGDMLVENGQVCTDFTLDSAKKMAARTAIGVTNDGLLILYTCDEAGNSDGLTLAQLAERMLALGCRTALNLDGGGSSTLWCEEAGVVNRPSDNRRFDHEGERRVTNCIAVVAE